MKVEDIMADRVVTIHMEDRLYAVQKLFQDYQFHHLLVVDNNKQLVSVISERDFLKACSPNIGLASENAKDIATLNKRVHQIMPRKLISLPQFSSLNDAIKVFKESNVSCLPIVNSGNIAVGIITWRDILGWLYEKVN